MSRTLSEPPETYMYFPCIAMSVAQSGKGAVPIMKGERIHDIDHMNSIFSVGNENAGAARGNPDRGPRGLHTSQELGGNRVRDVKHMNPFPVPGNIGASVSDRACVRENCGNPHMPHDSGRSDR